MAGKSFRFSLQTVLDLRRHEADRAEQALGAAMRDRLAQEEQLAAVRARRAEAASATPAGRLAPVALRRHAGFLHDLRRHEAEAEHHLGRLLHREGEARRTLSEKRRPEEALHALRDSERSAHRTAAEAAEAAFLDEQAVTGHARRLAHR